MSAQAPPIAVVGSLLATRAPGLPGVTIEIFTPDELRDQPWLSELAKMINESYLENSEDFDPIDRAGVRLRSNSQIIDEIGATGFTAVAFAPAPDPDHSQAEITTGSSSSKKHPESPITQFREIVGTASVKDWVSEGAWKPAGTFVKDDRFYDASEVEQLVVEDMECDGDYEIAIVAIKPGVRYRKRGIAERLVRICEKEILRRLSDQPFLDRPVRTVIKVVKELNGVYWVRRGFVTVGEMWCAPGTWGLRRAFVLLVMSRDLPFSPRLINRTYLAQ